MEEDRIQANLGPIAGPVADKDTDNETTKQPKQPKKRFVGRRTADRAEKPRSGNTIEDSSAIQGLSYPPIFRRLFHHADNIDKQSPKHEDRHAI